MPRPESITETQILEWNNIIQQDNFITNEMFESALIREVCYAGLYLSEQLYKLNCNPDLITRIQYTAGELSFGNDPWDVHLKILNDFINNKLIIE